MFNRAENKIELLGRQDREFKVNALKRATRISERSMQMHLLLLATLRKRLALGQQQLKAESLGRK